MSESVAFHGTGGETESNAMKAVTRRVRRLEARFGCGEGSSQGIQLVVSGPYLALDDDTCLQILRECGFLPARFVGIRLVTLCRIPKGLSAEETERFLREKGAEICGSRGAQNHGGPAGAAPQENQRR
jgi:hypothetical protein